jgi:hypothetical protein
MPPRPGYRRKNYELEPSENKKGPKAVEPHSPWQLMVETSRSDQSISIRRLGEMANFPSGTLFNWVRAITGVPPRSSYPKSTNKRIAGALGIEPGKLWDAFVMSLNPDIKPDSVANPDAKSDSAKPVGREPIEILLAMLRSASRSQFTLAEIEALAVVAAATEP